MTAPRPEYALDAAEGTVLSAAMSVARRHALCARECRCRICVAVAAYRKAIREWSGPRGVQHARAERV